MNLDQLEQLVIHLKQNNLPGYTPITIPVVDTADP